MTAEPFAPGPDTGPYEVIHLGGQARTLPQQTWSVYGRARTGLSNAYRGSFCLLRYREAVSS